MKDLHRLALWGNCELASTFLSSPVTPTTKNNTDVNLICKTSGQTPLYLACMAGNLDMAGLLLDHGACMEQKSRAGKAPLHTACLHGHVLVAKLLLDRGAQVDVRRDDNDNNDNDGGMTALHIASKYGEREVAELLLNRGANVLAKTTTTTTARDDGNGGLTPLDLACENNQLEIVWLLVYRYPWLVMTENMGFQ